MKRLAEAITPQRFALFAVLVLLYNLPVILWGAYVRVSFSGDGCGAHWPTCGGEFLPGKMSVPKAIEFTHRMMTSVDTVAVLLLVAGAFLAFGKRHAVRRYAVLSLVFLLIEALLGARLVLLHYVGHDQSGGRVVWLSIHLTNTMLLLAALTVTAWLAFTRRERFQFRALPSAAAWALGITIFVSITGTVTALGDTLFPAYSLAGGMQQDFSHESSLLLRLRVIHPVIALVGASYLVWLASGILRRAFPGSSAYRAAAAVIAVTVVQLGMGMLNLTLLAPLPMQLIHLLIADLLWVAVVLLAAESESTVLQRGAIPLNLMASR